MNRNADNWDQHWTEFQSTSEIAPSVNWRRVVLAKLLSLPYKAEDTRLLEIGCGMGIFARQILETYPQTEYLGLDISDTGIEYCSKTIPRGKFLQRDLLKPATHADDVHFKANFALCSEVLEHVDEPNILLENAKAYMEPGCKLVVTVPGGPMSEFHKHIGHRTHFTGDTLRQLLSRAGFEVEWSSGIGFPFFNLYMYMVKLRGKAAIEQFRSEPGAVTKLAAAIFQFLFQFNSMDSGWQIAAICRLPKTVEATKNYSAPM